MGVSVRDVWRVMRDGRRRSALELVAAVGGGTAASVTARVRDLRKPEWGEHVVLTEYDAVRGVFTYRLAPRVEVLA